MEEHKSQVLLVTSVSENEGKSTVAANLAISLAQKGKKVLLIDGDLKRPSQFLILGVQVKEENELGEYLRAAQTCRICPSAWRFRPFVYRRKKLLLNFRGDSAETGNGSADPGFQENRGLYHCRHAAGRGSGRRGAPGTVRG